MKVLIVEDEIPAALRIRALIRNNPNKLEIIGETGVISSQI